MTPLSYRSAGMDTAAADRTKRAMAKRLRTKNTLMLNQVGAFASLVDASFPDLEHPVLVLKVEEPGSKQKLAAKFGRLPSVCIDLVHHLINDIVVMGATPLAVLDVIVCGKLEPKVVERIVSAVATACEAQGCSLVGGETSEQPGVVDRGTYILAASIVGVVERSKIIDGSAIRRGDVVLAVASNGLHTNGYTLVRRLLEEKPRLLHRRVGRDTFLRALLKPHTCYYDGLRGIYGHPGLHGMAHVTGGGIQGNLNRILPRGLNAEIDAAAIRILPVFNVIQEEGSVPDRDMLRTFNLGVGMTLVVALDSVEEIRHHLHRHGHDCYPIGGIVGKGSRRVVVRGKLQWE